MRNSKIVWSLAALVMVLLGIGVGEYARIGSGPTRVTTPQAAPSAAPTVPAVTVRAKDLEPSAPSWTAPPRRTVPTTRAHPAPLETSPITGPTELGPTHSRGASKVAPTTRKGPKLRPKLRSQLRLGTPAPQLAKSGLMPWRLFRLSARLWSRTRPPTAGDCRPAQQRRAGDRPPLDHLERLQRFEHLERFEYLERLEQRPTPSISSARVTRFGTWPPPIWVALTAGWSFST